MPTLSFRSIDARGTVPIHAAAPAARMVFMRAMCGIRRGVPLALLLAVLALALPGCKSLKPTDTRPLDQAGMWYRSIEELRQLKITDAEVAELVKARDAGTSDQACIQLVQTARSHNQPFSDGDAVANLRRAGIAEATVVELARLNQLGLWSGEALLIRLTGFSDSLILDVARRRAAGQPVPSSASFGQLKNAGMSEADVKALVDRGATEEEVQQMIAAHQRSTEHSGFVRTPRRRRR